MHPDDSVSKLLRDIDEVVPVCFEPNESEAAPAGEHVSAAACQQQEGPERILPSEQYSAPGEEDQPGIHQEGAQAAQQQQQPLLESGTSAAAASFKAMVEPLTESSSLGQELLSGLCSTLDTLATSLHTNRSNRSGVAPRLPSAPPSAPPSVQRHLSRQFETTSAQLAGPATAPQQQSLGRPLLNREYPSTPTTLYNPHPLNERPQIADSTGLIDRANALLSKPLQQTAERVGVSLRADAAHAHRETAHASAPLSSRAHSTISLLVSDMQAAFRQQQAQLRQQQDQNRLLEVRVQQLEVCALYPQWLDLCSGIGGGSTAALCRGRTQCTEM